VWCFNLYNSLGSAVCAATSASRPASAQGNVYATGPNAATGSASVYAAHAANSGLHITSVCGSDCTEHATNATTCSETARGILHAAQDAGASGAATANNQLRAEYAATGPNATETARGVLHATGDAGASGAATADNHVYAEHRAEARCNAATAAPGKDLLYAI
jgi:hypothetical protein